MKEFEHLRIPFEYIVHATENFAKDNFVGVGGFGNVYKGEFSNSQGRVVGAVKRLDRKKEEADISFWREVMFLSKYKHDNIISLLGICDESEERILVYKYASNRSLDTHLRNRNLNWSQRLKICLGAACGLEHIHDHKDTQQRLLHRDVKSANILLDENWNAKISDFGLSKYGPANQEHTYQYSNAKGTLGYCDPMYIETGLLTKESDVYSFGVVLFEVLCSRSCIDTSYADEHRYLVTLVKKCQQEQTVLHTIIDVQLSQQFEKNSFNEFVSLAYQCLEKEPARRPSMASVVSRLKTALEYQQEAFEDNVEKAKRRSSNPLLDYEEICPPGGSNLVILYTTGIGSIQKTFNDCSRIRDLLKGCKVSYQERDVACDFGFGNELRQMIGKNRALPRLFIKGRYIGGVDEVLRLHEQGRFQPLLAGIPPNESETPCKQCAGNWFVICPYCNGNKMGISAYKGMPNKCTKCNENGLAKCPVCF